MKNPATGLLLLVLPLGFTFVVGWGNLYIRLEDLTAVDINLLTFQWTTLYHVIWFICGVFALAFYLYNIFVKGSCLYLFGVPLQIGTFVLAWIFWLILNGPFDRFDTLEVEDTTYHIIQTSANATGLLYLFTCNENICDVFQIGAVDSSRYFDAEMTYTHSNHTIYVAADGGYGVEKYIIPLTEN